MKIFLLLLTFLSLSTLAQTNSVMAPDTVFYKTYGGPNQEDAKDFIETYDKGFLICGSSSSFGQGTSSIYIVKTDSTGLFKWSKTYGGINADKGMSIVAAPDKGAYITGFSNSYNDLEYDIYCTKIDSAGNQEWERAYAGNDWDFAYASVLMPDSGLVIVGETYTNSAGDADALIMRIDKNGNQIWSTRYATALFERFKSVTLLNNNIYVCGTIKKSGQVHTNALVAKYNFSGNLVNSSIINGSPNYDHELNCINTTSNNQLIFSGEISKPDSILPLSELRMRTDTLFNILWNDSAGFAAVKKCNYIFEDRRGRIMTAYTMTGGNGKTAMFLADFVDRYYTFGSTYGGLEDEEGIKGLISSRNKLVFLGNTYSWGFGDKEYWLVMFKADTLIPDHKVRYYNYQDNIALNPFSINETDSENNYSIYPNPISKNSVLFLNIPATLNKVRYEITDIHGQILINTELSSGTKKEINLTTLQLAQGIYYIRFVEENNINVLPLLIQD